MPGAAGLIASPGMTSPPVTLPQPLDELPGFRRRFRIVPGPGSVSAAVEDDFHCMAVTLRHDGTTILAAEGRTIRAPWSTCPGAEQVLSDTFAGASLAAAARRGIKQENCTHLYDLVVLAAAHAGEGEPLVYDVLVADPLDGEGSAEIRRNGSPVLRWGLAGMDLTEPAELAGVSLFALRDWIAKQAEERREAAKILQWACLIAHGRQIALAEQSDATRMPPNCYTFQPDMARRAARIGEIVDFSRGARQPLETI